jgi:hypothetical protein
MTSPPNPLEEQMEVVLELLTKRTTGDATNEQVETAVSGILKDMGVSTTSTTSSLSSAAPSLVGKSKTNTSNIQIDTNDYDDDDDDDDEVRKNVAATVSGKDNDPDYQVDDDEEEDSDTQKANHEKYQEQISLIPMGKEGAKMMTTFGDGPRPIPESLQKALLGTRKSLQIAILDARALRRRAKQTFDQHRQKLSKINVSSLKEANELDPEMMYRCLKSHDKLSYSPPSGFELEQLETLFPEEMNSYQRWNDMYQKSQEKDESETEEGKDSKNKKEKEPQEPEPQNSLGGHLQERAAQFDARTDQMKQEWYLKFSQVRQGSFLPRGRKRKSAEEKQWDTQRKRQIGAGKRNEWEALSLCSVRFLHWLGFTPSSIRPPNEDTTQALAFLGHDFMGRIVEKAIYMKTEKSMGEIWELLKGHQLAPADIDAALQDPELVPKSLLSFGNGTSKQPSVQRYFGPGFEQRLELEMEE